MKRKSIIRVLCVAATMALAASCNDSYPGMVFEPDDVPTNDEDDKLDRVPISIYTKDPGYFSLITRGTGAFDPKDEEGDKKRTPTFYVFAFRAGTGPDATGGQGLLKNAPNLQRTAYVEGSSNADPDNQSCLLDGTNYNYGMPYVFMSSDDEAGVVGKLVPEDGKEYYYSGSYQDVGYNFFGYHIDDFEINSTNTHRETDKIWYDIDLDGYRDIMVGHSDSLSIADFQNGGRFGPDLIALSEEEKVKILSMYGGYSTYSGHRNVNPVINMKHMLARMNFQAYAADKSAKDVRIVNIAVKAPKKAQLYVAGRKYNSTGIAFDEDENSMADFNVSEKPQNVGDPYNTDHYPYLKAGGYGFEWPLADDADKEQVAAQVQANSENPTQIGSSILLAPCKEYLVKITYVYNKKVKEVPGQVPVYKEESRIAYYKVKPAEDDPYSKDTVNGGIKFNAGILYNIKIAVWGLQNIEIGGTVEGWKQSDKTIEIDPDNEDFGNY